MNLKLDTKLTVALTLYLTSLLAANTLGLKLMPFIFNTHISVAILSFPIVFIMTDVVGEVYGKQTARAFVWAGFISTALFMIYTVASLALPWSADGMWAQAGYDQVFGLSLRMALASLVAYITAEYQDVFSFFLLKQQWGGRYFWLRSQLSNLWSQLIDSVLFMVIAFAGVYPWRTLASIIITWWLYKVAMGILYSPLSYVGLRLLRSGTEQPTSSV